MTEHWDIPGAVEWTHELIVKKLNVIGGIVVGHATDLTPTRTGNLKNSITHQVVEDEEVVRIGSPVDYAAYVEFGTGEFAENGEGRKGGWVYSDGNGFHFTRGMRPVRFLRDGLKNAEKDILKELEK